MNVLRNLDINPSFISDLIFVQTQQDIKSKHAQTLIDSMQKFFKSYSYDKKNFSPAGSS